MQSATFFADASGLSLLVHWISCALAARRARRRTAPAEAPADAPSITIVQPHRGVEAFSEATLESIFSLDYPDYDILFCLASERDPIAPMIRRQMAAHPERAAALLFGDDPISGNPKLNNVVKGWRHARAPWVAIADSNVAMPPDYLSRLLSRWRADTGLVCSPPIGANPDGFAAHLECAFLNTYQARWQYCAEALGFGFAQGKTMLWRKSTLDDAGGVETLAAEIAEDAAATKIVRRAGLNVHLVEGPFGQPLGRRAARDVWSRQLRWARLRRATFAPYYAPEILTTSLFAILPAALYAHATEHSAIAAALGAAALWYGAEAALALASGWPLAVWSAPAWAARDLLLPWLWIQGFVSDQFEWRGAHLSVSAEPLIVELPDLRS